MTDDISESGTIVWQLACTLFITWVTIYTVLYNGIESLGKVIMGEYRFTKKPKYLSVDIRISYCCPL